MIWFLHDYICKDLISRGHIHRSWGLGLQHIFWGRHNSTHYCFYHCDLSIPPLLLSSSSLTIAQSDSLVFQAHTLVNTVSSEFVRFSPLHVIPCNPELTSPPSQSLFSDFRNLKVKSILSFLSCPLFSPDLSSGVGLKCRERKLSISYSYDYTWWDKGDLNDQAYEWAFSQEPLIGSRWIWGGHSPRQWRSLLRFSHRDNPWLPGKLTFLYRPLSLLSAVVVLSKSGLPFSSVFHRTHPWRQQAKGRHILHTTCK